MSEERRLVCKCSKCEGKLQIMTHETRVEYADNMVVMTLKIEPCQKCLAGAEKCGKEKTKESD